MPNLLVVGDDPGISRLLDTVLRRHGFTVETARDGAAGMAKLRSGEYAAVLLDLMLPVVSGFEIVEHLRSASPAMLRKTIVITAVSRAVLSEFDRSQIFALIRKPFDLAEVVGEVAACISKSRREMRGTAAFAPPSAR